MPLELLGVPKQLFVVEELEEALVELSYVVPPVFRELYHHHDQVELPDGDEVRHDEGAGEGGAAPLQARGEVAPAEYGELSVRQIQSL